MIRIVDYGMGNLHSVQKAFEAIGVQAETVSDPARVTSADRLVVPGVGAFPDAMRHLREHGLDEAIRAFAKTGRPLLGVCLGLQIFFEESEEYGRHEGLGLFRGKVVRFPDELSENGRLLKIPHMGWNTLSVREPALKALDGKYVYFVHSYYVAPEDVNDIGATTTYGLEFCSLAARDNVWAAQFHPEKSSESGMELLRAFAART